MPTGAAGAMFSPRKLHWHRSAVNILVLNVGSSTLKFQLVDTAEQRFA